MKEALENLRREVSYGIKKKYGLNEISIPRTLSSQILAEKIKGKNFISFKIKKMGRDKGILKFV